MVFVSGGYTVKIYDNQPGQAAKAITEIRSVLLLDTYTDKSMSIKWIVNPRTKLNLLALLTREQ